MKPVFCKFLPTSLVIIALVGIPIQPVMAESCEGDKQVIGAFVGALLGGMLGSRVGKGSGKKAATVLGAAAGGYAGYRYGESLNCEDQQRHAQATHTALETQPSGQPASWHNPDAGTEGTVTPTRTWQKDDGQYCRDYQQSIVVEGKVEEATGTACREGEGQWRIVASDPIEEPDSGYGAF